MTPMFGSWRKSSYSVNDGNCVEAAWSAVGPESVGVRDTKQAGAGTAQPALVLPRSSFGVFLREITA